MGCGASSNNGKPDNTNNSGGVNPANETSVISEKQMGCGASSNNGEPDNTNNSGGVNPANKETSLISEKQVPPRNETATEKTESKDKNATHSSKSNDKLDTKSKTGNAIKNETNVDNKANKSVNETEDKEGNTLLAQSKESADKTDHIEVNQSKETVNKTDKKEGDKSLSQSRESDDRVIQEDPMDQRKFDSALKLACSLLKPESVLKLVTKNVEKLHLQRALPLHFSLHVLLSKFENLKDLDISHNDLGPQAFRAICLAVCNNSTILSLNLAGSRTDTDSAECLGRMVKTNQTLQYLDVSSNYLGKDFFSRQMGEALKVNTSLKTLRCGSIGTTDARAFIDGLETNTSLTELDFSSNDISDKLGFAKGIANTLMKPKCSLRSLSLSRCCINAAGMTEIQKGLGANQSLTELNLTGSEFSSQGSLVSLIVTAAKHKNLVNLSLDSCNIKSQDTKTDATSCDQPSNLEVLSLNNCNLTDDFFLELSNYTQGKLLALTEIDIAANQGLTPSCLELLMKLTSEENKASSIKKILFGLNKADGMQEKLNHFPELEYINLRMCHIRTADVGALGLSLQSPGCQLSTLILDGLKLSGTAALKDLLDGIHEKLKHFPELQYINLRMCRLNTADVGALGLSLQSPGCQLSTLILDGLKLSGTAALKDLLDNAKKGCLSTLSLGSCSLDDNDLSPLCESIKAGLQLHMLKLSANRITDVGVTSLVEAVLKNKSHPLSVLDLSNNRIEDGGAKVLVKLFSSKSKVHSLNVSGNSIGKVGLTDLMSAVGGKSPLSTLYVQGQSSGLDEGHIVEVFTKLAASLGFKIQRDGEKIKAGTCDLPANIPERLLISLKKLGGNSGDEGQALDCPAVLTDYTRDRLPSLSLANTMEICAFLKGTGGESCVWSDEEWNMIGGADRPTTDTPSWLKVSRQRDLALYLSNLPGNTTQQKVEALLEMEADCNLDEACLMKDPVTRSINGIGWVVMVDTESVQKAVDYFNSGEAKVFGQGFMISRLNVKIDDTENTEVEKKAEEDRKTRLKMRQAEDTAHRTLIINTAEESWKRHAHRLAHPAYADGRIW